MEIYVLEIKVKEHLEEYITRLCYEETNSAIQTEYESDYATVSVYGSESTLDNIVNKIEQFFDDYFNGKEEFTTNKYQLENKDWSENWKSEFECIEFDNEIVIRPYFKEYKGNIKNIITINPSVGFGSGEHPTTKLMIYKLLKTNLHNKKILDIGSGSGILSIIAHRFGASECVMVEIDDDAGKNSEENFQLNNLQQFFELVVGDFSNEETRDIIKNKYLTNSKKFDIILMNILPNIILKLIPFVNNFLKEKGEFILSGIIPERLEEITSLLKKYNFNILNTEWFDNWARIDCNKL